jgi:hypothetical protein
MTVEGIARHSAVTHRNARDAAWVAGNTIACRTRKRESRLDQTHALRAAANAMLRRNQFALLHIEPSGLRFPFVKPRTAERLTFRPLLADLLKSNDVVRRATHRANRRVRRIDLKVQAKKPQ